MFEDGLTVKITIFLNFEKNSLNVIVIVVFVSVIQSHTQKQRKIKHKNINIKRRRNIQTHESVKKNILDLLKAVVALLGH